MMAEKTSRGRRYFLNFTAREGCHFVGGIVRLYQSLKKKKLQPEGEGFERGRHRGSDDRSYRAALWEMDSPAVFGA